MRAVVVDRWMEPKDLVVRELPDPTPRKGEVVIEVVERLDFEPSGKFQTARSLVPHDG